MIKGLLKGVFAPMAAGAVVGSVAAQASHLITDGALLGSFMNASSTEQGVAIVSSTAAAGLTGYALGKWKMKPWINIPS